MDKSASERDVGASGDDAEAEAAADADETPAPSTDAADAKIEVMSMVCTTTMPYRIDLDSMTKALPGSCYSRTELFPAVVFRHPAFYMPDGDDFGNSRLISMIVFASGKIIINGGKTFDDVSLAIAKVRPIFDAHAIREPRAPKAYLLTDSGARFAVSTGEISHDEAGNEMWTFKVLYHIWRIKPATVKYIMDKDSKWGMVSIPSVDEGKFVLRPYKMVLVSSLEK